MQNNQRHLAHLFTHSYTIPAAIHRRTIWAGLFAEVVFLAFGFAGVWRNFSAPITNVTPADNNITLAAATLTSQFPALVVLGLAVLLLVLLPGWIVGLVLDDQPSLVGSVLFGFASLGGVLIFSRWAQFSSIWPALIGHLVWQVVFWLWRGRPKAAALIMPPNWQWITVTISVLLLSLFMVYLNPVIRLDTFDNWSILRSINRVAGRLGDRAGDARIDWNIWISLNAWLTNLTGLNTLVLVNQLWNVILPSLTIVVVFSGVHRLSKNGALATLAAWSTLLVTVTSVGFGTLYTSVIASAEQISSDKWVALVLLVPAGAFVLADTMHRTPSRRTALVILIALFTGALCHPQALTAMGWIAVFYLGAELAAGQGSRQRIAVLAFCLLIVFGLIPLVSARSYVLRSAFEEATTGPAGIHAGWYVALSPDWFIPNPRFLFAPLLIASLVLTLFAGIKPVDPLRRLLSSWTLAVILLYITPLTTLLDRLWFPAWMDRFAWTLPFGVLLAVGVWYLLRQRRALIFASVALLTIGLVPFSHVEPQAVDWRLTQQPVVDQQVLGLVDYFRREKLTGTVLSEVPGPQIAINDMLWLQNPLPGIRVPGYGYPDIKKLYATPFWGAKALKNYLVKIVDWLIVERQSTIVPQIGLQPRRYLLTYENPAYLVYRVAPDLAITPIDELADQLADPKTLDTKSIPAVHDNDPYGQIVTGIAYASAGSCDRATVLFEQAAAQSPFAREPYLKGMANCGHTDQVRAAGAKWRADPTIASALLSTEVIGMVDQSTIEAALQHWLARPNYQRTERAAAREVAQNLAIYAGRPDLASLALHRLPDPLLESQDWLRLAHWSVLAGKPDLALYRRAGRDDLATLMEGELAADPAKARTAYQTVLNQSHELIAALFLGQTCESLQDLVCAKTMYQRVANAADPLALYGVQALIRLGENIEQNRQYARDLARVYALSYFPDWPAPVIRPLSTGQILYDVQVAARWSQPLTEPLPASRLLEITFTNPLPEGKPIYAHLGPEGTAPINLSVYIPAYASVTWTVAIPTPDMSKTETPLRRVAISQEKGSTHIADMLTWLPPRASVNATAVTPLAVFGDGLQLRDASVSCNNPHETMLTLMWLPTTPIAARYSLFIHAYDNAGKLVQQLDQRPFNDTYPTDLWVLNYTFQTTHTIPADKPIDQVRIGWYLLADGSRLPLQGNDNANGTYTLPVKGCQK